MLSGTPVHAWIALLMAVYALGAAAGELLRPGSWKQMLDDFAANRAISFLTGMVCIALGGAIYAAVDWNHPDWLARGVKLVGAGIIIEGFAVLAFAQTFMTFARRIVGEAGRGWALFSFVFGLALAALALSRF